MSSSLSYVSEQGEPVEHLYSKSQNIPAWICKSSSGDDDLFCEQFGTEKTTLSLSFIYFFKTALSPIRRKTKLGGNDLYPQDGF